MLRTTAREADVIRADATLDALDDGDDVSGLRFGFGAPDDDATDRRHDVCPRHARELLEVGHDRGRERRHRVVSKIARLDVHASVSVPLSATPAQREPQRRRNPTERVHAAPSLSEQREDT